MNDHHIRLFAATFTPFRADGALDLDRIPTVVDRLLGDGVDGLYVLGTTGEGVSLTSEERRQVAEAYVQAAHGRLPTVVQVGHNSLREARALAAHAQRIGAEAISAMPPFFFEPTSIEDLIDCMVIVAKGAPELPFYYYHIPAMTGVEIDAAELIRVGAERLPTLAGIKFSDAKVHELQRCRQIDEQIELFFGVDEMLLSGLVAGADGAVGSTYNFAAPLYRKLIASFEQGDLERAQYYQQCAITMTNLILRHCDRAGLKAMMALIGCDCGPHRLPLHTASPANVTTLKRSLEEIGFFEWGRAAESVPSASVRE